MDAAQRVREAGFPKVAALLDGTPEGAALAWRELARFEPCSMGEAIAKDRAMRALPEVVQREDGKIEFW
jgi:hypothetical protein